MKIRRIDFHATDWLEGTVELTDDDRGVYITICALIWAREGPINFELLKRHSLSHGNKLLASIGRLEKARKIVRKGLEISQKRARKELENARKRSRSAAENAKQRWQNNTIINAPAMPPHERPHSARNANHQPSTLYKNPPKPPLERGAKSATRKRSRNGHDADPFGLHGLSESELAKRFHETKPMSPEHEAIRQILFPGTSWAGI